MMANGVKVSIVIPVYNAGKYIEECLRSVISQTLTDIQIICVDDESTDNSVSVIQSYIARDRRLKFYSQKHQGAFAARNLAMSICEGEYIAFMDPDDYYPDENALLDLYTAAKENDAIICGGSLIEKRLNGQLRVNYPYGDPKAFRSRGFVNFSDYQYDYYFQRFIYRRSELEKNSIAFPPYLRNQDTVFFVNAMLMAKRFYALSRPTYVYRVSNNTLRLSKRQLIHALYGIRDLLITSKSNHLDKLHCLIAKRLLIENCERFYKLMNDDEFLGALMGAASCVDNSLLPEDSCLRRGIGLYNNISDYEKKLANARCTADESVVFSRGGTVNPKVSVIIPAYNVELYLSDCLSSLLDQTMRDYEVICVNDGSDDNSLNILMDYADKFDAVTIINQGNMGQSVARNTGVKYAKGEYIYFLDSDDMLENDALAALYDSAEAYNCDILQFDAKIIDEHGTVTREFTDNNYLRRSSYGDTAAGIDMLAAYITNREYMVGVPLQFFRRSFYTGSNLRFISGIVYEDIVFTYRAMIKARRVRHINDMLYLRRLRAESTTTMKKTFHHSYSLMVNYLEMFTFTNDNLRADNEHLHVLIKYISDQLRMAVSIYSSLDDGQKLLVNALPEYYKGFFRALVAEASNKEKILMRNRDLVEKRASATIENRDRVIADLKNSIAKYKSDGEVLKARLADIQNDIRFKSPDVKALVRDCEKKVAEAKRREEKAERTLIDVRGSLAKYREDGERLKEKVARQNDEIKDCKKRLNEQGKVLNGIIDNKDREIRRLSNLVREKDEVAARLAEQLTIKSTIKRIVTYIPRKIMRIAKR